MNKRIRKKHSDKLYRWAVEFLVWYTDVPEKTVIEECGQDIRELSKSNDIQLMQVYLDCESIDLMIRHKCGWKTEVSE